MNKTMSISDLCEFIWNLETKYDLLDFEIDGVKPWQYKRIEIYYNLAVQINIMSRPHSVFSRVSKFKKIFSFFINSIVKNPFFMAKKVDILVIPHPRVKEVNGKFIDIYTNYLEERLKQNNISFFEIEPSNLGEHKKENTSYRSYNDFIVLYSNIVSKFIKVNNIDNEKIKAINEEINKELNIDYSLSEFLISSVKKFKTEKIIYTKLLKLIQPKKIYLVVSYVENVPLIAAAKDLKIEVIELQHGTFSKYHLGYSYPNRKKTLDYFPDKIEVWKIFWKNLIDFPIPKKDILVHKFEYLHEEKKKYNSFTKVKNKAIVLSQGAISRDIADFILQRWNIFKNYEIIYKLHPGEVAQWKSNKFLVELEKKNNVTIEFKEDLYKLFSMCEYQIGVFSTAIYEGHEFNCKTILLNINGIEYMEDFILNNKIEVII